MICDRIPAIFLRDSLHRPAAPFGPFPSRHAYHQPQFFREVIVLEWDTGVARHLCIYTPHARGYHVRNVLPGNRRALPPAINMHSVKNRFLMRMKNITGDLYRRNWLSITTRDAVVIGACLIRERSSLKAFWYVARNWKRVMAKRREIMSRKRVQDDYIASWFHYKPVSRPASKAKAAAARAVSSIES